jgi:hypothetical protein
MKRISWHRLVVGALLVGAGIVLGAALRMTSEARAELRGTPTPQAFQTGGQLSVPLLKEIAATLHQMDGRLARLESAAQKLQTTRPGKE